MYCVQPIYIRKYNVNVPCGKCGMCVKRYISDWTLRCQQEAKRSLGVYFITLTYEVHPGQLYVKDVKDFFKRVRKAGYIFRYFALGDYGDTFQRPHFHVLYFAKNEVPVDFGRYWRGGCDEWLSTKGQLSTPKYYKGFTDCKQVGFGRIGYLVRYGRLAKIDWDKEDKRVAPFFLVSKSFGRSYLTKAMRWSHVHANRWWYADGKFKKALPRYYRDKIFNVHQREKHKVEYDESFEINRDLRMFDFVRQGFKGKEVIFKYDEMLNTNSRLYLEKLRLQKQLKNKRL